MEHRDPYELQFSLGSLKCNFTKKVRVRINKILIFPSRVD